MYAGYRKASSTSRLDCTWSDPLYMDVLSVKYRLECILDTVKPEAPAVQIVPGLIRYTWMIPKQVLLMLVRVNTQLYFLPNPVKRYWTSLFSSTFVQDLVRRKPMYQYDRANIGIEFYRVELNEVNYTIAIFFPIMLPMCFSNLRVHIQLLFNFLANIAIYYTNLSILK